MDPTLLKMAVHGMTDMDPNSREISDRYGTQVQTNNREGIKETLHVVLCQGVGQFRIQGWYGAGVDARWVPDPNEEGDLVQVDGDTSDKDRIVKSGSLLFHHVMAPDPDDPNDPRSPHFGFWRLGESFENVTIPDPNAVELDQIPGLGRALRFTFTLFDSRGIIEDGMTFTHIVYLDR